MSCYYLSFKKLKSKAAPILFIEKMKKGEIFMENIGFVNIKYNECKANIKGHFQSLQNAPYVDVVFLYLAPAGGSYPAELSL